MELDRQVYAIHHQSHCCYGRIRIQKTLQRQGYRVGHERIRQSLLRQGLRSVYRHRYRVTTDSSHKLPVVSNRLDRRFSGWGLHGAWVGDITFISTDRGWLYLACVLDLGSRKIVGYAFSNRLDSELACVALQNAYERHKPSRGVIMHTDRGSVYASYRYQKLLESYGMISSMSRTGNVWDNAVMESFFKTLKVECVNSRGYADPEKARVDIMGWIESVYNHTRIHSAIGFMTPNEAEWHFKKAA